VPLTIWSQESVPRANRQSSPLPVSGSRRASPRPVAPAAAAERSLRSLRPPASQRRPIASSPRHLWCVYGAARDGRPHVMSPAAIDRRSPPTSSAAGGDRATAATVMNDVLNRAYDRRRNAAAVEATAADASARRSAQALAKLQASGQTADESAKALASMTPEQIDELLAHELLIPGSRLLPDGYCLPCSTTSCQT
jgi:hypothetical protein